MQTRYLPLTFSFLKLLVILLLGSVWVLVASPVDAAAEGEIMPMETAGNAVLPGVVVEEVGELSAPAKAGLMVGDVVLRWERFHAEASEHDERVPSKGDFESPFDWLWMELEQTPRGPIKLVGQRDGEPLVWEVGVGLWKGKVRPRMSPALLRPYLEGKELIERGDLEVGIALWQELTETVQGEGNELYSCWLQLQIGRTWAEEQAWEKAHAAYRSALEAGRKPVAQVAVRDAIGMGYERKNELAEAEGSYRSALEIRQATWGESLVFAASLNNLGLVALNRGDLGHAAELFQRSRAIREELAPGSLGMAISLNNLGLVALDRGDLGHAAELFQRVQAIREELAPGSLEVATGLNNLGIVGWARGDLGHAAELLQRALAIREELAPESLEAAMSLNNLGAVAWTRGNLGHAAKLFQRALAIWEELAPGSLEVATGLTNLGEVAWAHGDLGHAAELFQRALAIREELAPGSLDVAKSLNNLGEVARARGDLEQAIAFLRGSMKTLEAQIGRIGGTHDVHGQFRADHRTIYRDALDVYLEFDQPEKAFNVLERSRARTFLAMLNERDLDLSADTSEDLDESRRRLATLYEKTLHQLATAAKDKGEIESLRNKLRDLRWEYDQNMEAIRRASPKLAVLQDPQPLELQGVRAALDPGTVLLSYSVGEERSDLFVVTRDGNLEVHSLPVLETLKQDIELFRERIDTPALRPHRRELINNLSHELFQALIEPARAAIEASERVVIVPDGPLHLLPFGALIIEPGTDPTLPGKFLVEWKPLHFVLSGTVYAELKSPHGVLADRGQRTAIAAFGDPTYPQRNGIQAANYRLRSAVERNLFDFDPLPYTRREVKQIAKFYSDSAQIYLGQEATEDRAKALGTDLQILHFAAHGYTDDRDPLNSAVALTIPEELKGDSSNGLLQAWEILESVRLNADLVVLSACETGIGEEQGGEGLISLSRAFQYAGARTVAASLWKVSDRVTTEFMVRFYRRLAAGQSKDLALRGAQLSLIRDPIPVANSYGETVMKDASAPYYWAAFQLYGDWR